MKTTKAYRLTGTLYFDPKPWIEVEGPEIMFEHMEDELAGRKVSFDLKRQHRKRTTSQNDLYWALCRQVIKEHKRETGEVLSDSDVHIYNLQVILEVLPSIRTIMGREVLAYEINLDTLQRKALELDSFVELHEIEELSSSKLNTYTFSILIELMIRHYAQERNWELKIYST